jgi:hypothetical protein
VDGNVVVVPAQGYEVVRVVIAAMGSRPDVMRLHPVPALAAVDLAAALVAMEDEAANRRWDGFSEVGDTDRSSVVTADDGPDLAGAEDLEKGVGADPWP